MNIPPILFRLANLVVAAGTGTILGVARWLTPSPSGHSTHLQLGLNECTFLTLTGYPCPMCGMTTCFTLLAHFRPLQALVTQPFGIALFTITVIAFAISLAEFVQPKQRWSRLLDRLGPYESSLATVFLIGMGLGWLYKIAIMVWLA